jgi:hypothetical protein
VNFRAGCLAAFHQAEATADAAASSGGPSVRYMQHKTLVDWNNEESGNSGTESQCAYAPKRWNVGYSFACFIYNGASKGVGTVQVTSTSSGTASSQTWNESFNPYG